MVQTASMRATRKEHDTRHRTVLCCLLTISGSKVLNIVLSHSCNELAMMLHQVDSHDLQDAYRSFRSEDQGNLRHGRGGGRKRSSWDDSFGGRALSTCHPSFQADPTYLGRKLLNHDDFQCSLQFRTEKPSACLSSCL